MGLNSQPVKVATGSSPFQVGPPVTSTSRGSNETSVDLPEPVPPTKATVSPGAMSRLTSVKVSASASGKR